MHIGIDCRFWGPKHTGLGRYTKNVVSELVRLDKQNVYTLFLKKEDRDNFQFKSRFAGPTTNFQNINLIGVDFPHYSFQEQFLFPPLIKKAQVELMHFPHFNIPIFYRGKFVVTIHDLIKNQFLRLETSTRNPLIYYFKYLNYRLVIEKAIKNSFKIITPSNFVKKQIAGQYKIKPDKIQVIYEGVDEKLCSKVKNPEETLKRYRIKKPFLLYVGNLYPHKNLIQLIKVVSLLHQQQGEAVGPTNVGLALPRTKSLKKTSINQSEKINLVIVSARDKFYKKLKKKISNTRAKQFVNFVGFVSDEDLSILYREALSFINPSLMEGFGLPGLEALNLGSIVLSSNRGSLPEIYQDAAIYFDPEDPKDLKEKINLVVGLSNEERKKRIAKGLAVAQQYSWQKCAKETLSVYEKVSN